jgi:hypothetical protein
VSTCEYEYNGVRISFKCLELVHNREAPRCIFHDISYLKGDNYQKNKEEVSNRFNLKLSRHSSNNIPLMFIGYCLPDISFHNHKFTQSIDFTAATFSGEAAFKSATFSKLAYFSSATFSEVLYLIMNQTKELC